MSKQRKNYPPAALPTPLPEAPSTSLASSDLDLVNAQENEEALEEVDASESSDAGGTDVLSTSVEAVVEVLEGGTLGILPPPSDELRVRDPGPIIPSTHDLAFWKGEGRFSGVFYTYPKGAERTYCVGRTLGFFPKASIAKLAGMFERHDSVSADVPAPRKASAVPDPHPPEGHVLARWRGPGRFSGKHFSFPAREEKLYCVGSTIGFFDVVSVKKLKDHFEAL